MTPRQQQLVEFIRRASATGRAPTYHEMREALGLRSLAYLRRTLARLQARGVLTRDVARWRSVRVVG
jgi:SOS-response transcriptional repressor LexA